MAFSLLLAEHFALVGQHKHPSLCVDLSADASVEEIEADDCIKFFADGLPRHYRCHIAADRKTSQSEGWQLNNANRVAVVIGIVRDDVTQHLQSADIVALVHHALA